MNNPLLKPSVQPSSKPKDSLRLSKYLAQAGIAARRKAEDLITSGRVSVNGKTVTQMPSFIDPVVDLVSVDGKPVAPTEEPLLFALYKPRGVMSTLATDEGPGLTKYLPKTEARLFPVGRLDVESEGLLLLTNDGQLALELTHPRYEHPKKYKVWLSGSHERTPAQSIEILKQPRWIAGKQRKFDNVELAGREGQTLIVNITIHEGLKHLIRRFCDAAGYTVMRLIRTEHGPYKLDDLTSGQTRLLQIDRSSAKIQ